MYEMKIKQAEPKVGQSRGMALLRDPLLNKGTAFSRAERVALGLQGLLPPQVETIEEQAARVVAELREKATDLERYIHLTGLQDRNETLFYRVVVDNLEETLPIIYTPTVGEACQRYWRIFRHSRGMYISIEDRGHIAEILRDWPLADPRVIVVTDGERILGLGDLGQGGMGIPVGKLSLYTACAGIHPSQCLPVMLDVGTDIEANMTDPLYLGVRRRRVRGAEFLEFVGEFVEAVQEVLPSAVIQFEDFANTTAFHLLEQWRNQVCTFNDDIQGTASVTLAGLYSALRVTGGKLRDQTLLFMGAGEAGIGIADLIVSAMVDEGATLEDARRNCWFVDTKGLVVKSRDKLAEHKLRFAHDADFQPSLLEAVRALKPTALIGVSTMRGAFDKEIVELMASLNTRPIIFALSNPTSKAECSAEEAYGWSGGRAIFASGSPFPAFDYEGRQVATGQGNNAYIFPGVGLGLVASAASRVTDRMFQVAARVLADMVAESDLALGRIYPSLERIREISAEIGTAVAELAFKEGLARIERPGDVLGYVKSQMWEPTYKNYVE